MLLRTAKSYCRDVTVIQHNPPLYQRAQSAIKKIIDEFTPITEPLRAGQNFLDVSGTGRLFGGPVSIAETLRKRFIEDLKLSAEAGLAANKMISKVAAFVSQPEGILKVEHGSEEPFIAPRNVRYLPAVEHDVMLKLIELNIIYAKQIRHIDINALFLAFGPTAFAMSRQSRGIDPDPIISPKSPNIIHIFEDLKEDTNDRMILSAVLSNMTIEACYNRMHRNAQAKEMSLSLQYSDGRGSRGFKQLREASDNPVSWRDEVDKLLDRTFTRRTRVRSIVIIFSSLIMSSKQLSIWDRSDDKQTESRYSVNINQMYKNDESSLNKSDDTISLIRKHSIGQAIKAMEMLNEKYGTDSVKLGAIH